MLGWEKANNTEGETWSSRSSPGERRGRNSGAAPDGDAGGPLGELRGSEFWSREKQVLGPPETDSHPLSPCSRSSLRLGARN